MFTLLLVLARGRGLRGTRFDPLGSPDSIRGFGVVKLSAVPEAQRRRHEALARLSRPAERPLDRAA